MMQLLYLVSVCFQLFVIPMMIVVRDDEESATVVVVEVLGLDDPATRTHKVWR